MEPRRAPAALGSLPAPVALESKSGRESFTRSDRERAHAYADSVARVAATLEDTLRIADQALVSGLTATTRGELPGGAYQLTKSLVATGLAAWQWMQLAAESGALLDLKEAHLRRENAERQLRTLSERARLVSHALGAAPGGDMLLREVSSTVTAFVLGFGIGQSIFSGVRLTDWRRSLAAAFVGTTSDADRLQVGGLGLPRAQASPGSGGFRSTVHDSRPKLSAREREVLAQIVAGLTTAQVATRLGVKSTTVATLVGRIFDKLGVNNRAAAVGIALRHGLCTGYEDGAA